MLESVTPFGVTESEGRWAWEDAGLVERLALLGGMGVTRVDLLMVREKATGRFVYTEQMERRDGETSWEYVRRSVRREAQIRNRFDGNGVEVLVGWGTASVDEFLKAYPEYDPRDGGERLEGETVDK